MLDPVQRQALAEARDGGIVVAGGPGTGKTRLANALAADAVARGLTCLLVGDDQGLDAALDAGRGPSLHPVLSARRGASYPARAATGNPDDPVALRASLFPEEAALAMRILRRAREIQGEHSFDPVEVTKAASRRMPSPRTMALIELACAEAGVVAKAFWNGNARPGRTLGEIAAVLRGEASDPPPDDEARVAALGGPAYDALCDGIASEIERRDWFASGVADLRRALDPWAWERGYPTVGDLHASLTARAAAFSEAAEIMRRNGSVAAAILAASQGNAALAMEQARRMNPDPNRDKLEAAFRRGVLQEQGRADALSPFLARHANTRLGEIEAVGEPVAPAESLPFFLEEVHRVRGAADRLKGLLADLDRALPPAALDVILGRPLDEVDASIASARVGDERTRVLRELAGLRAAFTRTGFGDVLAPGDGFEDRVAGAAELDDARRAEPEAAGTLDLFLDVVPRRGEARRPWPNAVSRWRPALAPLTAPGRYDVVVVDDAVSLGESDLASLRALADVVHLVGAERGARLDLPIPHRSLDATLANLGRPPGERSWAGGPRGAGVVVRTLPDGVATGDALAGALAAVRASGLGGIDALGGQGHADVVVLAMDTVTEADVVAAGARAGTAVLVLARDCAWKPPAALPAEIPPDESLLASYGWNLVSDSWDGRVYVNGDRSAIVTDEPDDYDLIGENVAQRVARLSDAGWSPIVAWRGSPRGTAEMLRLVERNAVPNGSQVELELATFPLPAPRSPSVVPFHAPPRGQGALAACPAYEGIPDSPYRAGSFQDVVWKLKWVREEVLLPFNPDPRACLLTDDRIVGLIRMGIDEEAIWQARFRGPMLRGADARQLAVRDLVMDVVSQMPRTGVALHSRAMVEAVEYRRPATRTDGPRMSGRTPSGIPAFMAAEAIEDAPALRM